jgi:RNA polymerase sigma-70 factor (ECF subfamily)
MLEKSFLRSVDRNKGKFRSFLIAALEHFLAKEWRRAHAQKRGGYARFMSLDDDTAEQQYLEISASTLTPEQLFDQQWAISLLEVVLKRLSEEFAEDGKANAFAEMKIFLTGEKGLLSYAELAPRLDTSEAALKMAVSRMRQRYGELLRAEISRTVAGPEEVEEELRSLFASLSL